MADPEPASPVRRRKSSQHDVERGDAPGCSSPMSAASPLPTYTRQKSVKELVEETTQTPPYWELVRERERERDRQMCDRICVSLCVCVPVRVSVPSCGSGPSRQVQGAC